MCVRVRAILRVSSTLNSQLYFRVETLHRVYTPSGTHCTVHDFEGFIVIRKFYRVIKRCRERGR